MLHLEGSPPLQLLVCGLTIVLGIFNLQDWEVEKNTEMMKKEEIGKRKKNTGNATNCLGHNPLKGFGLKSVCKLRARVKTNPHLALVQAFFG